MFFVHKAISRSGFLNVDSELPKCCAPSETAEFAAGLAEMGVDVATALEGPVGR